MKKTAVILFALVVFLAAAAGGIQWAANRQLARLLPDAGRLAGGTVSAATLGVSLWRGEAEVRGLQVTARPGFSESNLFTLAEGRVVLRYLPLFRGRVRFSEVTARDMILTMERAADGRINVARSGGAGGGPPSGPGGEPGGGKGDSGRPGGVRAGVSAPVAIDRLSANGIVRFLGPAVGSDAGPRETRLIVAVAATNLAAYGSAADEAEWGTVSAEGALESGDKRAPLRLTGRIAPLTDPLKASFRASGTVEDVDPDLLRSLMGGKDMGIRGEAGRVEFEAACDGGRFDRDQSRLVVTLRNVKSGKRAIPSLTVTIPVSGTVEKPKLGLEQAMIGALAQLLAAPEGEGADSGTGEKKSRKKGADIGAIVNGLESLFKGK